MFNYKYYRTPFVESPFYEQLKKEYSNPKYDKISDNLNSKGYVIVDLNLTDEFINQINTDVKNAHDKGNFKKNSETYQYNESPRIVEGWKFSSSIKELVLNKELNDILTHCYQSKPIPISTINFLRGTEQPMHSDEFHYGTIPHRYLTGCWVALEDIDPQSGPLSVVAGSHKLPIFSLEQIGQKIPKNEREQKEIYTIYEEWVKEMIKVNELTIETPAMKKGQCLIWLSNTLHGAFEIINKKSSRKSIAIHYHYEKCEKIFYPSFSNLESGRIIERSLRDLAIK